MDTAERLFGEQGYAATSLRQIIAEAGVNLAAIHYHFGSKEDLLDQLVVRKAGPVNEERIAMLDRLEAEYNDPPLAGVIRAFMGPAFRRIEQSPGMSQLMGRLYGEGIMPHLLAKHFQEVLRRFGAAFQRALPHLSETERVLRIQFMVGAMAHVLFGFRKFAADKIPAHLDSSVLLEAFTASSTAALAAPATMPVTVQEKS